MPTGPEYIRSDTVIAQPDVTQAIIAHADVAQADVAQAIVEQPVVTNVVHSDVAVTGTTSRSSYTRSFALDAWVTSIAGLAITVIGLLAITRGGFDGSMDDPVVQVIGFNHTTLLGLIEATTGAALLISAASRSRGATLFVSAVIGIAAFVAAVQRSEERRVGKEC